MISKEIKKIKIGNIFISRETIPVQTMLKNNLSDLKNTLNKIKRFHELGCDILRIAVPDLESIKYLRNVIKDSILPIVADIHFDHKLAIKSIEAGAHKIRINPGNIGNEQKVKEVINCLKEYDIPVRIGINGGSLPKHLLEKYKNDKIKIMLEAAKEETDYFEKYGFDKVVLSFKSSNVLETIEINKLARKEFYLPLHIGVTEAGGLLDGTVKNSVGISTLLQEEIGETIRVSLTADEENEIFAGIAILEALGLRKSLFEVISCPTCGRTKSDIKIITELLKKELFGKKFKNKIKIAVMGCEVNGPGEAKDADFGVACGNDKSVIFKNGSIHKIIKNNAILDELLLIASEYVEKN
jgi:(E)-4-hydroxy-3-methylbut-2-enyl-diphosphate synthase